MELYQLRQFVAVVETASFTKGAERCAVSQPAISASIAKLESEVGVQLLVRQKKQVVATQAGKRLFDTAVGVLSACSAVKADLKQKKRSEALRIGVVETLPASLVSSLMKSFRREHDIAIEVWDGKEQELNARLVDGRLDAALTILRANEKISAKLQSRALFSERSVLVVPSGHRLAGRPAVRMNDLTGEAFISRTRCENYLKTGKLFAELGVRPHVVYRASQDARALEFIGAGIGVAIMPASYESPDTEAVAVEDLPLQRTIGLRWARENEKQDLADFVSFAGSHHWPNRGASGGR